MFTSYIHYITLYSYRVILYMTLGDVARVPQCLPRIAKSLIATVTIPPSLFKRFKKM